MLGVLTLFLIPVGGGIPAGVLLAKKIGLLWPVTLVLAAFVLSGGLAIGASAAEAGLSGTPGKKIWVFAVSVLEFREKSSYASFPKKDRRDAALIRHFIKDRGVPESQVVWLKDSKATLSAVRAAFRGLLARTGKGDLLFFYYTGHGDREKPGVTFFIPHDSASENTARTAWSAPEIIKDIEERFRGDRAILAADCCHSGGICRHAQDAGRRVSYACLASAQSSSESTGEWTFTDNLLRGLRGGPRADLDGDGRISLGEQADSAEAELAFAEGQLSASAFTGIFARDWALAAVSGARTPPAPFLVKGRPYHPPAPAFPRGAVVYAEWEKTWYKASVEDFRLGLTHISYDGFGSYWDEWVPAERLRGSPPCSPVPCSLP